MTMGIKRRLMEKIPVGGPLRDQAVVLVAERRPTVGHTAVVRQAFLQLSRRRKCSQTLCRAPLRRPVGARSQHGVYTSARRP